MDNDDLLYNMESISQKLDFYKKKFTTLGWEDTELQNFYSLGLKYVHLECQLFDNAFNGYILEDLLNKSIIRKLKYLNKKIGWKFNTLINREDIVSIQTRFENLANRDKIKVIDQIAQLQLEIEIEWNKYSENYLDILEDISLLFSHDNSNKKEVISDYILKKFSLLINVLGGERYYESIKKSS